MAELILDRQQKAALRADAHHLAPVVLLGREGLTEEVAREVDRALSDHGLVKVRVPGDDRGERAGIYAELADRLGAARIQLIGKVFVLYRPVEEKEGSGAGVPAPRGGVRPGGRRVPARPPKPSGAKGAKRIRVRKTGRVSKKSAMS